MSKDASQMIGLLIGKPIPIMCCMYLPSVYKHYNLEYDRFKQDHMKHDIHIVTPSLIIYDLRLCLMFKWPLKKLLPIITKYMPLQQLINCCANNCTLIILPHSQLLPNI